MRRNIALCLWSFDRQLKNSGRTIFAENKFSHNLMVNQLNDTSLETYVHVHVIIMDATSLAVGCNGDCISIGTLP